MNYFGIFSVCFLFALSAAILWASENEARVRLFLRDFSVCVRCVLRGEDL